MSYYNSISNKYNRFILLVMMVAPFVAFILLKVLHLDFLTTLQLFTYIGVILILFYSNVENQIRIPNYLWFYFFFILYSFYSSFYQLERDFKFKYLFTNRIIGAFNFMFIIENVSFSKKYFNFLYKINVRVLIIAIGVIIIQQVHDKNFFVRPDMINVHSIVSGSDDRMQSIYSWVSALGNGFGFIPIFLIVVERKIRKKEKIILWIVLGLIYALLTKGRWMMINALVVFILLFVNKKDKFKHVLKYIFLVPLISLSIYFTLNVVGVNVKAIVEDRILEKGKKEKSAGTRILAIKVFNKLYWKNIVFGVGDRKYGMGSEVRGKGKHKYELTKLLAGKSSQIHVGYLMLLYIYGLVGGSFFLFFLFLITRKLYKDAKKTTYWGPFLGFLGFGLSNLSLVHFTIYEIGLIFALLANQFYVNQYNKQLSLKRSYSI